MTEAQTFYEEVESNTQGNTVAMDATKLILIDTDPINCKKRVLFSNSIITVELPLSFEDVLTLTDVDYVEDEGTAVALLDSFDVAVLVQMLVNKIAELKEAV